jgi:hypothetical protein
MIWLKIDYLLLSNNDSLIVSKIVKICHVTYPITCWCTDIVDSHVVVSNIYIFYAEIMLKMALNTIVLTLVHIFDVLLILFCLSDLYCFRLVLLLCFHHLSVCCPCQRNTKSNLELKYHVESINYRYCLDTCCGNDI